MAGSMLIVAGMSQPACQMAVMANLSVFLWILMNEFRLAEFDASSVQRCTYVQLYINQGGNHDTQNSSGGVAGGLP